MTGENHSIDKHLPDAVRLGPVRADQTQVVTLSKDGQVVYKREHDRDEAAQIAGHSLFGGKK